MTVEIIDTDPIRKEQINDALKKIEKCVEEMCLLREYNFNGLFGPEQTTPAKYRLLHLAHDIASRSAYIMLCAAELSDEENN
jgi:hypothetical protein